MKKIIQNKKILIISIVTIIILITGIILGITLLNKEDNNPSNNQSNTNESNTNKPNTNEEYNNTYEPTYTKRKIKENIDDTLIIVYEGDTYYTRKYGIINSNGNIVEEIIYNNIFSLEYGYYLIDNGEEKILKRNNNEIAKITQYEPNKFYKDENDQSAPYIMLSETCFEEDACEIVKLDGRYRAVYIKKSYDTIGSDISKNVFINYGSIIYDIYDGKIIKEIPGKIEQKSVPNSYGSDKYIVEYNGSTWFSLYTYYDNNFNNIMEGSNFFVSYQCPIKYSQEVTNINTTKSGYYSIKQKKQIIPIMYDTIYSHDDSETLFVVKNNDKYSLVNNNNEVLLSNYDYMIYVGNYIITLKENQFKIFDRNLKSIDEYTYEIDKKDEKIPNINTGLCDSMHPYLLIKNNYFLGGIINPTLISIPTTSKGIITLEITDKIKVVDFKEEEYY